MTSAHSLSTSLFVSLGGLAIDLGDLAQPSQTDYSMGQIGHQQHYLGLKSLRMPLPVFCTSMFHFWIYHTLNYKTKENVKNGVFRTILLQSTHSCFPEIGTLFG